MTAPGPELNFRERQLHELVAGGASDEQIAAILSWPLEEVAPRIQRLADKLELPDRAAVAAWRPAATPAPEAPPAEASSAPSPDARTVEPVESGLSLGRVLLGAAATIAAVGAVAGVWFGLGTISPSDPAERGTATAARSPTPIPRPTPTPVVTTVDGVEASETGIGPEFPDDYEALGIAECATCSYAPRALVFASREGDQQGVRVLFQFPQDASATAVVDHATGNLFVSVCRPSPCQTVEDVSGYETVISVSRDGGATWTEEFVLDGLFHFIAPTVIFGTGLTPTGLEVNAWLRYPGFEPFVQAGTYFLDSGFLLGVDGEGRTVWNFQSRNEVFAVTADNEPVIMAAPAPETGSSSLGAGLFGLAVEPGGSAYLLTWQTFIRQGALPILVLMEDDEVVRVFESGFFASGLKGDLAWGLVPGIGPGVGPAVLDLSTGIINPLPGPWGSGISFRPISLDLEPD